MRPEKLECLLDLFIVKRNEIDTVDGIPAGAGSLAVEYEDPLPHIVHGDKVILSGIWGTGGGALVSSPAPTIHLAQLSSVGRQLADLAAQFSMSQLNSSCVRFEKSCIIVSPVEQTVSVTVIRSDTSAEKVTKVTWKTHDKTAISGIHYVDSSGEIVFGNGVTLKTIQIKILQSSDDAMDLRFNVEMSVDDGFNPKPMTVALKKLDDFYPDERQVVKNFPFSLPFTVEDIRCILGDSLTSRTFHMALTHLCSAADSVHLEFALALDLSRLCMQHLRRESILEVLKVFFRMEDIDC